MTKSEIYYHSTFSRQRVADNETLGDIKCTTHCFNMKASSFNKCSAVAEMGDRFATIDMGRGLRTQATST